MCSLDGLEDVKSQVAEYVRAIGISIDSAKFVFIIAQHALDILDNLTKRTPARELRSSFRDMVAIISDGIKKVQDVENAFRNVRRKMNEVGYR